MIASLLIPLKTIYNKIFKITCTVTETLHPPSCPDSDSDSDRCDTTLSWGQDLNLVKVSHRDLWDRGGACDTERGGAQTQLNGLS